MTSSMSSSCMNNKENNLQCRNIATTTTTTTRNNNINTSTSIKKTIPTLYIHDDDQDDSEEEEEFQLAQEPLHLPSTSSSPLVQNHLSSTSLNLPLLFPSSISNTTTNNNTFTSTVSSMAISPLGDFLVAAFINGTIRLYPLTISNNTPPYSIQLGQIEARGMYTSLIIHIDISQDNEFIFAGAYRGSTELIALQLVPKAKRSVQGMIQQRFAHSDAKLKGFGAVHSSKDKTKYMLLCGKGIKNLHVWQFRPQEQDVVDQWNCILDLQTNGMTVELVAFCSQGTQFISKSQGQNVRVWDIGRWLAKCIEKRGKKKKMVIASRPISTIPLSPHVPLSSPSSVCLHTPNKISTTSHYYKTLSSPLTPHRALEVLGITFRDVLHTQDTIHVVGSMAYGGNETLELVCMDREEEEESVVHLALANGSSINSTNATVRGGRMSRTRKKLRTITKVLGTRNGKVAMIICSNGSVSIHERTLEWGIHTPLQPLKMEEEGQEESVYCLQEIVNGEYVIGRMDAKGRLLVRLLKGDKGGGGRVELLAKEEIDVTNSTNVMEPDEEELTEPVNVDLIAPSKRKQHEEEPNTEPLTDTSNADTCLVVVKVQDIISKLLEEMVVQVQQDNATSFPVIPTTITTIKPSLKKRTLISTTTTTNPSKARRPRKKTRKNKTRIKATPPLHPLLHHQHHALPLKLRIKHAADQQLRTRLITERKAVLSKQPISTGISTTQYTSIVSLTQQRERLLWMQRFQCQQQRLLESYQQDLHRQSCYHEQSMKNEAFTTALTALWDEKKKKYDDDDHQKTYVWEYPLYLPKRKTRDVIEKEYEHALKELIAFQQVEANAIQGKQLLELTCAHYADDTDSGGGIDVEDGIVVPTIQVIQPSTREGLVLP